MAGLFGFGASAAFPRQDANSLFHGQAEVAVKRDLYGLELGKLLSVIPCLGGGDIHSCFPPVCYDRTVRNMPLKLSFLPWRSSGRSPTFYEVKHNRYIFAFR